MPPDQHGEPGPARSGLLRRWVVAFADFWWDFFVGDTPELVPGVAAVLGGAAVAVHQGAPRIVVIGAVPVLATIVLCASVLRRRKARAH
jgi:hypothetical protein